MRSIVLDWWRACATASKTPVRPAEWIWWAVSGWRRQGGRSKPPPIPAIFSPQRVLDGKKRRIFRLTMTSLGGGVVMDSEGKAYAERHMGMSREMTALVLRTGGEVLDEHVRLVVTRWFPRGVKNAATVLKRVHTRCVTRSSELTQDAVEGKFIWTDRVCGGAGENGQ